jgi:hypothetical protein
MRLFLDTEFNGFGGELISLALVSEAGGEWYASLPLPDSVHPWVLEHVVPKLGDARLPKEAFLADLHRFLRPFHRPTIVCDWFEDAVHLLKCFSRGSYQSSINLECLIQLVNTPSGTQVTNPHNALDDARDLRDWFLRNV